MTAAADQIALGAAVLPVEEEAAARILPPILQRVVGSAAVGLALFHLATAGVAPLPSLMQRAIHLGVSLVLVIALYPVTRKAGANRLGIALDVVMVAFAVIGAGYVVLNWTNLLESVLGASAAELVLGAVLTLVVLEAARRTVGLWLPTLAIAGILYAYAGAIVPPPLGHSGLSLQTILETLYVSTDGLWSSLVGTVALTVAPFLVFGAMLQHTGGGDVFVDLARKLVGWTYGGSAKVSVISSSLFGTISGSAVANVVVDGVFNIPLMKRAGYRPEFAAAVEAVASSGGQLVPPIMGAGAFLMAEALGVSYWSIAIAAAVPAALYYVALFLSIHWDAKRHGYGPIDPRLRLPWRTLLRRSSTFLVPAAVLVAVFYESPIPEKAAFWATVTAIAMHVAGTRSRAEFMQRARDVIRGLESGGRSIVVIAVMVAASAVLVAMFGITGLSVKVADVVFEISRGSLVLGLVATMAAAIVLGFPLPTTAAYVVGAAVAVPALLRFDILPIAAHLFVFYYAILAVVTPPVCTAVYVAAALAKVPWGRAAGVAVRLSIGCALVPFMFVYRPALLLIGSAPEIIWGIAVAVASLFALSVAVIGYWRRPLELPERVAFVATAALLVFPDASTDVLGFVALLFMLFAVTRRWLSTSRWRTTSIPGEGRA